MKAKKTTILLTNDDGYDALGLKMLAKELKKRGFYVIIVAPFSNKSACAHSITLNSPLSFIKIKKNYYALKDGTPSDCVNLALSVIFKKRPPDLVISGINAGANLAEDVTYSGTAAAAMEATLCGVQAIAFSEFYRAAPSDFSRSSKLAAKFVKKLIKSKHKIKKRQFLNINYPDASEKWRGYKVCKMGQMRYKFSSKCRTNPRGLKYFWLDSRFDIDRVKAQRDDIAYVRAGFAAISPCKLDLSAGEKERKKLKKIFQ